MVAVLWGFAVFVVFNGAVFSRPLKSPSAVNTDQI